MHIYFQLHFTFTIMQHPKNKKKQKNKKQKTKKSQNSFFLFELNKIFMTWIYNLNLRFKYFLLYL